MYVRILLATTTIIVLAGCGGGSGSSGAPGPSPANGLTLAQLSDGEFSSSRNSGGYGKSMRYREPNPAAPAGESPDAALARVLSDGRRFQGVLFTDSSETGLINAVINDVSTTSAVQLVDRVYVATNFPDGNLELQALDLGAYDSVLGGMWRYVPNTANPQTFTGGWHAGSLTDVADLPTGSSVAFSGNVIGVYVRNDNPSTGGNIPLVISQVTGNASIEMNFVTGDIVEGPGSAMFNLVLTDLPGETLNDFAFVNGAATAINGNTWDAELSAINQNNDMTDFSAQANSDISGRFYGPGSSAQEMGSAFRVREDNEREIFSGMFLAKEITPL